MIGKAILNIMVIMMIEPIFMYQSGVRSVYLPCNKKDTDYIPSCLLYFIFIRIITKPMFIINKNERFIV